MFNNISTQAYVSLMAYLIASLILFITNIYVFGLVGFVGFLLIFLIMIPLILLSVYNQDCLTKGNCNTWSWITTVLNIVSLLISTVSFIMMGTVTKV